MTATTKESIDKLFKENVNRLSGKYYTDYERVYGLMKLVEGDLKIMRTVEFKSNKETFYRKVCTITNGRLYIEKEFKSKKALSEAYMK